MTTEMEKIFNDLWTQKVESARMPSLASPRIGPIVPTDSPSRPADEPTKLTLGRRGLRLGPGRTALRGKQAVVRRARHPAAARPLLVPTMHRRVNECAKEDPESKSCPVAVEARTAAPMDFDATPLAETVPLPRLHRRDSTVVCHPAPHAAAQEQTSRSGPDGVGSVVLGARDGDDDDVPMPYSTVAVKAARRAARAAQLAAWRTHEQREQREHRRQRGILTRGPRRVTFAEVVEPEPVEETATAPCSPAGDGVGEGDALEGLVDGANAMNPLAVLD